MDRPRQDVRIERDVPATMRDGTILRADVYRPSSGGPYPSIVFRTPYGKGGRFGPAAMAEELASYGYLVVIQDIRGRFASQGDFVALYLEGRRDGEDGFDTVQWAATLPGSTGRVGALGTSYIAAMAWELAPLRPPALGAMCVHGMVGDSRGLRPGDLRLSIVLPWNMLDFGTDLHRRAGSTEAPLDLDEAYRLWEFEHGKWLWYLPLADLPESRLGPVAPFWKRWLASDHRDTFRYHERGAEIDAPILHVGGWYDMAVESIDLYTSMVRHGRSEQRLVVGPWTHSEIGATTVGDLDFGPEAATTFAAEGARWFDRWLGDAPGRDDGERPVKLFVMGANRWRAENEWPPARAETATLYLGSGGRLGHEAPAEEPPDEFLYDPRDPVPTLFVGPYAYGAPFEQGPLDHRRDVLVYLTEPLEQGLEVTGHVEVVLFAASSARDTDWTAKLVDVHPDGRAYNVTQGFLRARFRDGFQSPSLLEPDRVYEFRLKLYPTSMLFLPGHRIRLDISSSDFPAFDRNHNTGGDDTRETELVAARQRVFHDGNRASQLLLPVIRS